jgi:hypothetical protein
MPNLKLTLFLAGATLTSAGFAASADLVDEPIQVTTFELKDGKKFEAVAYAALGKDDLKSYVITDPAGTRSIILEREIVSRKKENVAFVDLDEASRREVLRQRKIALAKKADQEAAANERKLIADAKLKESAYRAALNKAADELALASDTLTKARDIVRNSPVDVARADARYDAAKTELAATAAGGYAPPYARYTGDASRNDYLRHAMVDAAEDKAKAESAKREAEEVIARTQDKMKKLEEHAAAAQKEYDAATLETKQVLEKVDKAERDRMATHAAVTGKPQPAPVLTPNPAPADDQPIGPKK